MFLRPIRDDFGDTGCASGGLLIRDVKMRAAACRSRADQGWLLRRRGAWIIPATGAAVRSTGKPGAHRAAAGGFVNPERDSECCGQQATGGGALVPISPVKTVLASRWARRAARRSRVSHIQRSQGSAGLYGSAGRRVAGPARSAWRYRGATLPHLPRGPRYSKAAPG